eukprot:5188806-Amphidinium_carterae.1
MSKRKPAAVKAWESVLQSGTQQKQLDATERLLRLSWVLPLPVLPSNPWIEPDGRWCEAQVIAVSWTTGPGTPITHVLLAIPGAAYDGESEDHVYVASLYLPGTGPLDSEPVEEALVKLVLMPGDYLVKRLGESVPRADTVLTFAEAHPSAVPAGSHLTQFLFEFEELTSGVLMRLEDSTEDLRVTHGDEELGEETYHSTGEMDFAELREALVPPASSARRKASGAAAKADLMSGAPGGKRAAKAASAMPDGPSSAARPKSAASPRAPQSTDASAPGFAELLAAITELSTRINTIENRESTGRTIPLPGAAAATSTSRGQSPSLLDPGRVPPPGHIGREVTSGVPDSAGSTAYLRTMAAARQLLGEREGGPPAESRGPARPRVSEERVREQVLAGGIEGMQATQLAILEVVERLQQSTARGQRERGHDTLEDILWGLGGTADQGASGSAADDNWDETRGSSSKGLGGLTRLQAAMSRHPDRCSALADQRAWKMLGSDVSQTPWSMQLYAQQHIRFGRLETHQRMWDMLACFHSLARQRDWAQLDMRVTQCLKACEQSVQHGGSWKVAWLHTGIHDSRGNVLGNTGLAHPSELSLAVQVLKDQKALDEALKKSGAAGGGPPNAADG